MKGCREKEIDSSFIKDCLTRDSLGRNLNLSSMIRFLISTEGGEIISLDGKWGSGKTVFLKQLEYIKNQRMDKFTSGNESEIKEYRKMYRVFYFNAWENDFLDDPTQAFLLFFLKWIDKNAESHKSVNLQSLLSKIDIKGLVKNLTKDALDLNHRDDLEQLVSEAQTGVEKQQTIRRICDAILKSRERLLVIIDELDRCRPNYAVRMLEAIKSYLHNNRTVFLIATDNSQFAKIIEKYYGVSSGEKYLDKIYDFRTHLPEVSKETFASVFCNLRDEFALNLVSDFDLSLREIKRFSVTYRTMDRFFDRSTPWLGANNQLDLYVRFVLAPLCVCLKFSSPEQYEETIFGKGSKTLEKLLRSKNSLYRETERKLARGQKAKINKEQVIDNALELYARLYQNDNYETKTIRKRFINALSMLSADNTYEI